jgi:hypothetical protein
MVPRVTGARAVVEQERLLRCDRLRVADEGQRAVGGVGTEVVPLLRRRGLLDRMFVVDQVGVPLVGLGAEEAVEALEPPPKGPLTSGGRQVHLVLRTQVPLPHCVGVPALLGSLSTALAGR